MACCSKYDESVSLDTLRDKLADRDLVALLSERCPALKYAVCFVTSAVDGVVVV
jgi:hypothetical protein